MRARYGRGPWQLLKWLVDPFALTGVYLLLVTFVLDVEGRATGLSLACAIVPFQLVIMTVINALDSLRIRSSIVATMSFPRGYIPLASAFTESVAFGASLVLLALMVAVYGASPGAAVVWLPLVLATTVAFAGAIAYPAALFALWLPDLRQFALSVMRTLFFLAPGLVALDQIGGTAKDLVRLNPLTGLFESYRSILLDGQSPAAWELLYPLGFAAVVALLFVPLYLREAPHLAKVAEGVQGG